MTKTICRICLRTDLRVHDIDETLADFHDEIADYAIYPNAGLKYCTVCEYVLKKCYNFSRRCRQANEILNEYSIKKIQGYPSNLHEKLPSFLGCSIPSTLQQYNLIDGNLIPLSVQIAVIKQDNDTDDDLDTNEYAQVTDTLQTNTEDNDIHTVDSNDCYVVKIIEINENNENIEIIEINENNENIEIIEINENNENIEIIEIDENNENVVYSKLVNIDLENEDKCSNKIKLENSNENEIAVKFEDHFNSDEDSSDTELINEFNKIIKDNSKGKKNSKIGVRKPLRNNNEINSVFEVHLFATDQEAREELALRKTSDYCRSSPHICKICNSVFKHAKSLDFHMRWHDLCAGDHECDICHMRFKSKDSVKNHKHHAHVGRFKCKKCPMITYNRTVMMKHYQQHAGMTFECKICSRTYTHSSTFNTHMRLQHRTEHVCVSCARTFVSEKGLIAHRGMIHNTKSLEDSDATTPCEPCGLIFANEQVYTVHLKNTEKHKELANTIIACRHCGLRFEDLKTLKEHRCSQHYIQQNNKKGVKEAKSLTTEKDNFKCAICGLEGTSRIWVYKHVLAVHPDSPYAADLEQRRQHMCETCGKCYTSPYVLRDHMITHTGLKPHACKQCPARFTTRMKLKFHEECHAPAKRECNRCGKKFISASNLSNHMRSHIQDRRYKCSLCHKGFLHSWSLREHIRGVHNNLRRVRKLVKNEDIRES